MRNLQSLNITRATLQGSFRIDDLEWAELNAVLVKHEPGWPSHALRKTGYYEVEGVRHRLTLMVGIRHGIRYDFVTLSLSASPIPRPQRALPGLGESDSPTLDDIQAIIQGLTPWVIRLRAQVDAVFPPGAKRALIGLPLMTFQVPDIPLTEVSGIRMRSRSTEGLTTATIDLREDNSIATTLAFPWTSPLVEGDMLDSAVDYAADILSKFLLDLDQETGEEEQ